MENRKAIEAVEFLYYGEQEGNLRVIPDYSFILLKPSSSVRIGENADSITTLVTFSTVKCARVEDQSIVLHFVKLSP